MTTISSKNDSIQSSYSPLHLWNTTSKFIIYIKIITYIRNSNIRILGIFPCSIPYKNLHTLFFTL